MLHEFARYLLSLDYCNISFAENQGVFEIFFEFLKKFTAPGGARKKAEIRKGRSPLMELVIGLEPMTC